jgi:hypothetical protein
MMITIVVVAAVAGCSGRKAERELAPNSTGAVRVEPMGNSRITFIYIRIISQLSYL